MNLRPFFTLTLTLGYALGIAPASAQLDLNGDGLSDLWQLRYALNNSQPGDDPDGDGMSNLEENIAGTNPLDPSSCFEVPITASADRARSVLTWNGVAGKQYFVEGSNLLNTWSQPSNMMISSGGPESISLNNDQEIQFWRVGVRDIDRDADGLSDAEELMLGFDPTDPHSAPSQSGESGGDLARAVSLLTTNASFSLGGVNVTGTAPESTELNRFLTQAVMGASTAEISALEQTTYSAWIEDQFTKASGKIGPELAARLANDLDVFDNHKRHAWWRQFLTSDDALRQRVAFALSQIFVISDEASLNPYGMGTYYDMLLDNSFGNVRDLLQDVTLHPIMGVYLSHLKNRKADPSINRFPDENYAREVMQLFTIGLFELYEDGTRKKDTAGNDIPTYTNEDITNFARVFTGLSYGGSENDTNNRNDFFWGDRDRLAPMKLWEQEHDQGSKALLNGVTLPAYADDPGRTGMDDINDTLDHLFNHPNTGPFLSRLLLQRMVTSNPSPGYIQRVAQVFADDGNGVRGNMKAIIKAILLDSEARQLSESPMAGKLREPFIRYARLGRIFTARAADDSYLVPNWGVKSDLGQRWLSAPSVFNYYLPDHQPSGDLAEANLFGPEFQIMTAVTSISSQNFYKRKFDEGTINEPWTADGQKVNFQWDTELALTSNPVQLVEHLNGLIAAGQLSARTRGIISDRVAEISSSRQDRRLREAMRLIYLSPDFAIFR